MQASRRRTPKSGKRSDSSAPPYGSEKRRVAEGRKVAKKLKELRTAESVSLDDDADIADSATSPSFEVPSARPPQPPDGSCEQNAGGSTDRGGETSAATLAESSTAGGRDRVQR